MTNHYKSIVVAVDGLKQAEYAFHKGVDVAKRNNGSVLNIVNVIDTSSFAAIKYSGHSIAEQVKKQSEELLNDYKEQVEAEGVNVNTLIEFGSPKTVITTDVADSVKADLILCGATGLNAVERFLVGSVTDAIVRTAKCDVLVIRTPELID